VSGNASGPGLVGSGVVGTLPCFCADAEVTLQMRTINDRAGQPIGVGPFSLEVWGRAPDSSQMCPP